MYFAKFENYPYALRQAAMSWAAWRHRRYRFGDQYREMYAFLAESQAWSHEQTQAWQHERLVELVKTSRAGCAYYAAHLPDSEEIARAASLADALKQLPVLEKASLKAQPTDFRNRNVDERLVSSTSGSTGSPMTVGHDAASIQRRFAFFDDHFRLGGTSRDEPSVRLSGRVLCRVGETQRRPWLYSQAENQLFLSSYHLDDAHGPAIAAKLARFQPVLMDGYPSGILETLRLVSRHGGVPKSLKAIITTAETLYPDTRDELQQLAGAAVMDYYGASEGVPYIQQCPYGVYHVRWQSGIFEVSDGGTVSMEGDGELVCTSFVQDRTPLIRYQTGDLVSGLKDREAEVCRCGLATPTVDAVQGRLEDLVYTPDGRALGMFTYRTLKYIDGLGETQVIQQNYDDFEVRSVVSHAADTTELADAVKTSFERALGYPVRLKFDRVTALEKGANGKVRLVISKVARRGTQQ